MNRKSAKQHAGELLDKLKEIDAKTAKAYYEMGQILSSLEHGDLYREIGYPSFFAMVEEELSFAPSTALCYLHTYRHFKRLKYKKSEALDLIHKYSFTRVSHVLPTLKQAISSRAMRNQVTADRERASVVSFMLTKEERTRLENLLIAYGAERKNKNLQGVTEALKAIMDEFDITDVAA